MSQSHAPQIVQVALPVPLDRTFSYRHDVDPDDPVRRPVTPGDLVQVPFGRRPSVVGLVVDSAPLDPDVREVEGVKLKSVAKVLPQEYRLEAERLKVARWMAEYYLLPLGEIIPLFHPPGPGTRWRKGIEPEMETYPEIDAPIIRLTDAQQQALSAGESLLENREYGALLLHGVTGSGKTEVYLTLMEKALELGKGSIFLLPEIALTPQTLARIQARFGNQAMAIHSGMAAGQRCRVHEMAARGEVKVVVGPRSALFAPVRDLGVIVMDEEHESSYKQDEKPRYHARQVALIRGRENRAVVMLGSATPDLESVANVETGRFTRLELPDRLGSAMPGVTLVDLRGGKQEEGFSPELVQAIEETLEAERQVILYYNRRGFARVMQCRDCGEVVMCPNCDIGLTYHLRPRRLLCHYCGFVRQVPAACPDCEGPDFLASGGGTEKVELFLQSRFPEARLLRLDRDSTTRRGSHRKILSAFARREADILVGTQMVAKGHHFPGVGLVGVLAADDGLGMPDYRAAERSFQLLTQVAGRSGRNEQGRVIFQTWQPEHPVITAAAAHDFDTFAGPELRIRGSLGYPPGRRLIRLSISGRKLGQTEEAAGGLARALRESLDREGISILGPAPAVFPRLKDRFRFQILIKGTLRKVEKQWLAGCLENFRTGVKGVDAVHDIDPVTIY